MNEGLRIGMCEEDESWRRTRKLRKKSVATRRNKRIEAAAVAAELRALYGTSSCYGHICETRGQLSQLFDYA